MRKLNSIALSFLFVFSIYSCSSVEKKHEEIHKLYEFDENSETLFINDENKGVNTIPTRETKSSISDVAIVDPNNEVIDIRHGDSNNTNTNKVTIMELGRLTEDNIIINNIPNLINKTVKTFEMSNHPLSVLKSFLDINGDFLANEKFSGEIEVITKLPKSIKLYDLEGIVNESFGYSAGINDFGVLKPSSKYFDKRGINIGTNAILSVSTNTFTDRYVDNKKLIIKALGNSNNELRIPTQYVLNDINVGYHVMSPELQKLFRAETILAASTVNAKDLYDYGYIYTGNKYDGGTYSFDNRYLKVPKIDGINRIWTSALHMRSFTLGAPSIIFTLRNGVYKPISGTSFSAPRISRAAYEVKKKFPFLSYQQVKQVLLTTADRGNLKYLDNEAGWGALDLDKALKGPSDFNAGLIEEQKFFRNNLDKIYDKEGNLYFYVDIENGKEYTFDNDITSGLKGDGNNEEYEVYKINGAFLLPRINEKVNYTQHPSDKVRRVFNYSVPKVLDSEKNFYANIKTAGLRKDGDGTLVLNGFQDYNDKTLLQKGKIVLNNSSKSTYNVFNEGTLEIGRDAQDGKLAVRNINSDGKVVVKNKLLGLDEYNGSSDSILTIDAKSMIKANSFKTNGKLALNISGNEKLSFDDLKNKIKIKVGDRLESITESGIKDSNLKNFYLKTTKEYENGYVSISFQSFLPSYYKDWGRFKTLGDLSHKEKRNLPSYDYNERKFFDEYLQGVKYKYSTYSTYEIQQEFSDIEKALINLKKSDEYDVKSRLFTDVYSSFYTSILENNNIFVNQKQNLLSDKFDNNALSFNTYHNTNIYEGENFNPFSKYTTINTLSKNIKVNDKIVTNLNASIQKDIFKFKDEAKFDNTSLILGNITKFKYGNHNIVLDNSLGINYTLVNRKDINNENVKLDNRSSVINSNITYGYNISSDKINTNFIPFIFNSFTLLNVAKSDVESGNKDNRLNVSVNSNNILKDSVGLGLLTSTNINDKLVLENRLQASFLLTNDIANLKLKIQDVNFDTKGKPLDKYNINYDMKLNYKFNDRFNLDVKANIDNNLRMGIGLGINVKI